MVEKKAFVELDCIPFVGRTGVLFLFHSCPLWIFIVLVATYNPVRKAAVSWYLSFNDVVDDHKQQKITLQPAHHSQCFHKFTS